MFTKLKNLFQTLFLLVFCYFIFNADLLIYGIEQGKGQLSIIANTQNINELMLDTSTPDSVKLKLSYTYKIRNFAFDSLGLNKTDNYTTYYDLQQKPLIWVVTACQKYKLQAHEWSYSFLGKMPYKGFFKKEKAWVEYYKMKDLGYDVSLGTVGGFSTLGWFTDPVLSSMLEDSEGELAELLLHELTHSTLFVKDSASFNENLAQFIGEKGAEQYLVSYYGKEANQLKEYTLLKKKEVLLDSLVVSEAKLLNELYNDKSFEAKSVIEKEIAKQEFINQFADKIENQFGKNDRTKRLIKKIKKNQNTFFMQFIRYNSKHTSFEDELNKKYNRNIKEYLNALKLVY
ncbi:MAG: aminopeptidase [Bacteroidota bacterium]